MTHIHIGPRTQVLALLAVGAGIAAAIAAQAPEIRRYLKIEAM